MASKDSHFGDHVGQSGETDGVRGLHCGEQDEGDQHEVPDQLGWRLLALLRFVADAQTR